jgi:hypothetical protein
LQAPARVQVAGTRVLLIAPTGFEPARRFNGLESPERGASVMIAELAGPVSEMITGLTPEEFKRKGVTIIEQERTRIAGRDGLLLFASQKAGEVPVSKWIGVFGDEDHTVMITAVWPQGLHDELEKPLRECIMGSRWDPALTVDPFAHLPYRIDVPQGLLFQAAISGSLVFTRSGKDAKEAPETPGFVLGPSLGAAKITDVEAFANGRLRSLPLIDSIAVESSQKIESRGLSGWEIVARAVHSESKTKLFVHLVVLLDADGYYLLSGRAGEHWRSEYLPIFRQAVNSFRLVPLTSERGAVAEPR